MSRVVWRPISIAIIFLSASVQHKQAANIGGSGQNVVKLETTTEEATTSRGLLVSSGPMNFTVQSGTRVTLHCRVELHEENSSVSWLRRSGDALHLISVNTEVFKDDPRYKVNYIKPVDWQLFISPVNFTDQGNYECQISSLPPVVHSIYLHVLDDMDVLLNDSPMMINEESQLNTITNDMDILLYDSPMTTTEESETSTITNCGDGTPTETTTDVILEIDKESPGLPKKEKTEADYNSRVLNLVPELEIADERNLPIKNKFYNSGSTIELRCRIVKVPQPTQFIIWKHNSSVLNYDTTRGGISVKTDILPDGAKSHLFIANVSASDSGNYSCSLGEDTTTWVSVVVITGETPAAMQHGSATMSANIGLLTAISAILSALS